MSENIEKAPNVPPFVTFVTSTVPMVFDNSLSYYEALSALWKWLQDDVINVINNNATVTEDYIQLTDQMKEYMDNYFDNLDVQQEINNKLDKMTEDGSLTALIKAYVDPIYQAYETEINSALDSQDIDIANFKANITDQVSVINTKVNQATSGSPLVASSVAGMTNTNRIYVNTSDGNWYYYDGDSWEIGGVYQSTSDSARVDAIEDKLDEIQTKVESKQLFNYQDIVEDKNLANTFGVSTPYDMTDSSGINVGNLIMFDEPLTSDTVFYTNIQTFSRLLSYHGDGLVREGNYSNTSFTPVTDTVRQITINASVAKPIRAIRFSYLESVNPNIEYLFFCKASDYTADFDTHYKNYYELNDKLDVSHLICDNPINYTGNEVNTFYKGIAIGDSLTEGTFNVDGGGFEVHKQYAYPMYFYKKTGTTLRNFGVGGATAQSWYERYENVTFPVYDFAIIALGVNDILQSVSNETTITYISNIVTKLKSQNADVKVFISTLNRAYKDTAGWDSLNTAIKSYVSSTSGCYLLDIAALGKTDVGTDYVNGHLTALGYRELANEYANIISYIMNDKSEEFAEIQFSGTESGTLPTD